MSDIVYIGRVKWVHESYGKNYRHATVEPLIQSSADQMRWIGSIEDPLDDFPARGFVNWHDSPKGLKVGDYRQFDVESHPFYEGQPDKEAFQIRNQKNPVEIVDLRNIGSEREIRILLTTKGVFINAKPLIESCVLWIRDEKWIGPVDLAMRTGTSSWILAPSQPLSSIRCWKIHTAAIQQVELEGSRYLLTPNHDIHVKHMGFVTWEADNVLAKRLLNRLLKRDRKSVEALKISKAVFKTYIDTVEKAGLVGSELDQEFSYRERIQEIIDVIAKNEELMEEAASVCFNIGTVKQKIAEKAKKEYEKRRLELLAQLDSDFADKKRAIKDAEIDLEEKKSQLVSLQDSITAAERNLEDRVDKFEAELTERLRKITEKPERLFAEMAFFKAISSAVRPLHSTVAQVVTNPRAVVVPEVPAIREPSALIGEISQRLLSIGVSPQVGHALHCALSSGSVPVMIGSDAIDVIRSYADCVSGGVLQWIPIGGSLIEPADLLGRIDPLSHSFIPHPGGLLELLMNETDIVQLVVLDGFNRAASDGYLLPLLQSIRDAVEGHGRLTIPLVPPGMMKDGDPYVAAQRVAWKPNVLLVLRPTEGTSVLPVPRELWEYCVIIDTVTAQGLVESPPKQATRVSKTDWERWFNKSLSLSGPQERLFEHPKTCAPLPSGIRRKIERINGSGLSLGLSSERAIEQALKLGLVPYLMTCGEPLDEWIKILGLELDEKDRRVEDIVQRMGEY